MSSYTIPNVIAQHPRGERIMDVYLHLLTERIVYLGTGIDSGVANTLIAQLLHLEADSAEQEINLYINCEGGDLRADIEAILSAHTGQSVQTLRADTDRDRVLTARAALEYGLADQVIGQRELSLS